MALVSSFIFRETRTAKFFFPPPPPPLMGGKHLSQFNGIVKWISQKKLWIKKAGKKGITNPPYYSRRGNHAQWLFDRGQETIILLVLIRLCRRRAIYYFRRTVDRLTLANRMAVAVPRYTEHGNRRILTLSLCRRRTV